MTSARCNRPVTGSAALLQRMIHILTNGVGHRGEAEEDTSDKGDRDRTSDNRGIDGGVLQSLKTGVGPGDDDR